MAKVNSKNWRLSGHLFEGVVFDHVEWTQLKRYRRETIEYLEYSRDDIEEGMNGIVNQIERSNTIYGLKF